jgi:hypothetical protein
MMDRPNCARVTKVLRDIKGKFAHELPGKLADSDLTRWPSYLSRIEEHSFIERVTCLAYCQFLIDSLTG